MKALEDIAKRANISEETLRMYRRDFEPFYFMYEDIEEGIYKTVYTDGDGGLMLFEGHCEMFEEQGVSMRLIDCTYCDIPYSLMTKIMQELEKANNSEDF
tara:strand:- start:166 stop:465 length:300 start_codon:yes stop_codon:yes gene_type:complete